MSEDHKRMRKIIEENGHLPNDTIARIVQKETRRVHSSEEIASYRLDHKTAAERPQADRYQSGRTRARASLIALATITALGVGATAIDYMKSSAAPKSTARDYVTPEEMVFLDARGTLYKPTSLDITDLRSSGMLPDLIKMYEAQQKIASPESIEAFRQCVVNVERRTHETRDLGVQTLLTDAVRSMYQDPVSRRVLQH